MTRRDTELAEIKSILADAVDDEPLTAREIYETLQAHGLEYESVHQVATVLGYGGRSGNVEVIQSSPYRYQVTE